MFRGWISRLKIKSIKLENFEHFAVTALIGLMLLNFSYYFFYEIFGNVLTGLSLILFFIFIFTQIRDKKLNFKYFIEDTFFIDIGTPVDYLHACKILNGSFVNDNQ